MEQVWLLLGLGQDFEVTHLQVTLDVGVEKARVVH